MLFQKNYIPILTYHNIYNNSSVKDCPDWINALEFELHLKFLEKHHFTPISFSQLFSSTAILPAKPIILTFDDGYESCYSIVFNLLKKYNFKATFFIITDYIAHNVNKRYSNDWNHGLRPKTGHLIWPEIKEMVESEMVEIGSHTKSHRNLLTLNSNEVDIELKESKKCIEDNLKVKASFFSYPGGAGHNNEAIRKLVEKNGYTAAIAAFPPTIQHINRIDNWNIKRIEINKKTSVQSDGKSKAKNKLITRVYPLLFRISKYNSLNSLVNFLIRLYKK